MIQDWLQARQNLQNWNDVAVKFTREFPLLNFQGPGEIDSLTVTEVIAKGKEYEQHLELFKAKDIIVVWVRIAHAADLQVPHIDELETFTTVEEFINKSTEFAKWFDANREALQGITELDLEYIELISIPNQIWQLTNLQKLNLGENQLTSIPKEIGQLTNLQQLFLDKNQLTSIPNEIGHLTNLHNLNLNHNHLISIPNEIGHLTNLQLLELQHNQLRSVPSQIGMLDNLRGLDLENNQLTSFPPEIVMLTNLEALDLSSNQLTDIPFALLLKRINLNITNNPFSPLRRAIFLHTKAVAIAASTVALTLFGLYYNRNWVQDALYSAGNALRSYLPF
ncbi:MAG: leucine-rich repeat domain-containing protein [Verrucomicrobia bacterium]|nr:leucine-rich repeat domain-containing protein [Verrucomicrobiota bacterium]